jgi:hypothetical protein
MADVSAKSERPGSSAGKALQGPWLRTNAMHVAVSEVAHAHICATDLDRAARVGGVDEVGQDAVRVVDLTGHAGGDGRRVDDAVEARPHPVDVREGQRGLAVVDTHPHVRRRRRTIFSTTVVKPIVLLGTATLFRRQAARAIQSLT